MPFESDELMAGMIAYYTVDDLRRHSRVQTRNLTRDTKTRPFVCYAISGQTAYWTALTTSYWKKRVIVDRKWLRVPPGFGYACDRIIVSDARLGWVGPVEVFAHMSRRHDRWPGMYRPYLLPGGVEELTALIRSRGGPLPEPVRLAA